MAADSLVEGEVVVGAVWLRVSAVLENGLVTLDSPVSSPLRTFRALRAKCAKATAKTTGVVWVATVMVFNMGAYRSLAGWARAFRRGAQMALRHGYSSLN